MPGRTQRAGVQSLGRERRASCSWEHSPKEEGVTELERDYLTPDLSKTLSMELGPWSIRLTMERVCTCLWAVET